MVSFLDVLANAMGAVVVLFVVLSALSHAPTVPIDAGDRFIRLAWTVEDDPGALLRIRLTVPSAAGPEIVEVQAGPYQPRTLGCLNGMRSYSPIGFDVGWVPESAFGIVAKSEPTTRSFVLWIHDPDPGVWQARALYFDRSDGFPEAHGPIRVHEHRPVVEGRSMSILSVSADAPSMNSSGALKAGPPVPPVTIRFGEQTPGVTIEVDERAAPQVSNPSCRTK